MFYNKMIVFVGPTGAGKTAIAQATIKLGTVEVVSTTTRRARPDEVNAVHYHFVTSPTFEKMIEDDLLVEHAKYDGNYYGVAKLDMELAILQSRIGVAVCVMEIVGFLRIAELYPDLVIGVFVDTDKDIARHRLLNRPELSEAQRARRMALYDEDYKNRRHFEDGSLSIPNFIVDNNILNLETDIPHLFQQWLNN